MKKKSIFIYPSPHATTGGNNPYIKDLSDALEDYYIIINKKKTSGFKLFSFIPKLIKCDYFFFNWIESISSKKYGTIKYHLAFCFLYLIKRFNKKIIWTHHNKQPHNKNTYKTKKLSNWLINNVHLIITHTTASKPILEKINPKAPILFFFHPIKPLSKLISSRKESHSSYDILIWGSMTPYKGLIEFLKYVKKEKTMQELKIKVIGKFINKDFYSRAKEIACKNTEITDTFIKNDDLYQLHKSSEYILFPYSGNSVLNSGALIDSLVYGSKIIGPNIGAFHDLEKENIIFTYNSYSEIKDILTKQTQTDTNNTEKFKSEHTWSIFASKLYDNLNNKGI